ncbi:hypothetical protein ACIBU0_43995 [Streptomyces sp. NPDC049627]|uniref:hypothetical protein n=1 Tax=Streptomyces sp. NPDC049627 TaxID=3365595 RepID=UPI0037AACDE0
MFVPGEVLDHYVEALVRKPGALPGATALEQAEAAGKFARVHDAWWAAACKARGDRDGTRALIDVLLLARRIPHGHLVAGLAATLRVGALTGTPSPWMPARPRTPTTPTRHGPCPSLGGGNRPSPS